MTDRKMMLMKGEIREPLSPVSAARASARTPSRAKSVSKPPTPGSSMKAPTGKNENYGYDRFIPNRKMMDNDANNYHILMKENNEETEEFEEKMKENLNSDVQNCESRILKMKIKAPENKEGEIAAKLLYTTSKPTPSKPKTSRFIPATAMKILDAPDISNDYYLNLLDWGSTGLVAIALYQAVYLWDSVSGSVIDLFSQVTNMNETLITSVKWITSGNHIAVGLSNGTVELWDASTLAKVRAMRGHDSRVGTVAWNGHILTSGCKSGDIHNHDVRIAEHHTSSFNSHSEEVCGMEWAPDCNYLASGGNDYALNIWDLRKVNRVASAQSPVVEIDRPVMSLTEHTSAVKAVAWCPWQRHVLASGGGIVDRQLRVWNTNRGVGTCLNSVDVMSQISDILWSGTYKEIICSYGNNMGIWKYANFNREAELTGHSERILAMTMSPDGQEVGSVGADETLRLWKCFEAPVKKTKSRKDTHDSAHLNTIR